MFSCREIISGYIKKHAQKTLANKQMKYFFLWSKYSLSSTKKLFLWLSRNLFLLPKYNKAAESVFLTKYCALRNVISFFIAKYNHDKFSSDISCQGIEEFEYLPSIRPKFEYIPSIRPKGSYIAFID